MRRTMRLLSCDQGGMQFPQRLRVGAHRKEEGKREKGEGGSTTGEFLLLGIFSK